MILIGRIPHGEMRLTGEIYGNQEGGERFMTLDYFEKVVSILKSYENLGKRILPNGTQLIGHAPQIAPEAYLHNIFPPLDDDGINELEKVLQTEIPKDYKEFLKKKTNGLHIFIDTLALDGLRSSYERTGDAAWQPYNLSTINIHERPRDSKDSYFYIGGYSWDGSLLYIDSDDNKVYRCTRYSSKPLNEWQNFEDMLVKEVKRIASLFDEKGNQKDPDKPTTP
jgi:hypothetical protein